LGGQRIRDERNKQRQTTEAGSTGSEPGGSARRKIGSVYEFKLNKIRNVFFHDRPHTRWEGGMVNCVSASTVIQYFVFFYTKIMYL
jgi:hypothetical protein